MTEMLSIYKCLKCKYKRLNKLKPNQLRYSKPSIKNKLGYLNLSLHHGMTTLSCPVLHPKDYVCCPPLLQEPVVLGYGQREVKQDFLEGVALYYS